MRVLSFDDQRLSTRPATRGWVGPSLSLGMHGIVCGLILLVLRLPPRLESTPDRAMTKQFMELEKLDARTSASTLTYHADHASPAKSAPPSPTPERTALPLKADAKAIQTLLQPDLPKPPTELKESVPFATVWSADPPKPQTTVAAPPKQILLSNQKPLIEAPNHEIAPAPVKLASTNTIQLIKFAPSTVSPLVVPKVDVVQPTQQTISNAVGPTAPARIISASDIQRPKEIVAIPKVNSVAPAVSTESPTLQTLTGVSKKSDEPTPAHEEKAEKATGPAKEGTGHDGPDKDHGQDPGPPVASAGTSALAAAPPGVSPEIAKKITQIHRAKTGQFGVVVVGSQLADDYPETVEVWGNRMVYTVYLQVGWGKNWILQYALPKSSGSSTGNDTGRPSAPWPYEVARPNTGQEPSDPILMHGFVSSSGHMEKLAMLDPAAQPQAKLFLDAFQLWEFKPAQQSGHDIPVEVLLIIPATVE